jgi:hydroxyacyl-ACP dehydratase HTD2-like protein with hotdog domain
MSCAGVQISFEDVEVGASVPVRVNVPSTLTLFRFSAVTWNAHRIHYDREFAQAEGHADVLVQAHLHGAWLTRMVMDWIGPRGRLLSIEWKNLAPAFPLDTLTCAGVVASKARDGTLNKVKLDLVERNQHGSVCASGSAEVTLPARDG